MPTLKRIALAATVLLWGAGAAQAQPTTPDGVTLLSQTWIMAHGGFPFLITQAGSYRLASNLIVSDHALAALLIKTSDVTVDLNGFTIHGQGAAALDNPSAIYQNVPGSITAVTIRNGFISGWPTGVALYGCTNCTVEQLSIHDVSSGIFVSDRSQVSANKVIGASGAGAYGIVLGAHGIASRNNVTNFEQGISVGANSLVAANDLASNSFDISAGAGTTRYQNSPAP